LQNILIVLNADHSTSGGVMRHNQSRHRMSGNNVNLKFEHRQMPLIGALGR
jgi:hypothetical protein